MNRNSNNMSTGMALLLTIGVMLLIGSIGVALEPDCRKSGCDNKAAEDSSYCYLHGSTWGRSYSRSYGTGSYKSQSKSSTSGNSSSASYKNSGSTSGYSSSKPNTQKSTGKKSYESYDEGYDDVYMDDDYDWDRYNSDDDYAMGVDDAIEDAIEEGEDW